MENYLKGYYFIYPVDSNTVSYLATLFGEDSLQTSDNGPIDAGFVVKEDNYDLIKAIPDNYKFEVLRLSSRFDTIQDFITEFWDGDTTESDFYYIDL